MSFGTPRGPATGSGVASDFTFSAPPNQAPYSGLSPYSAPPDASTQPHPHNHEHHVFSIPSGMQSVLHPSTYSTPSSHTPSTRQTSQPLDRVSLNGAFMVRSNTSSGFTVPEPGLSGGADDADDYRPMSTPTPLPNGDNTASHMADDLEQYELRRDGYMRDRGDPLSQARPEPLASATAVDPDLTHPTIVQPLFIDKIGKDFELEEHQIVHLHTFALVGATSGGLSKADLATRVYMLGAIFAQIVERKRAAAAAANGVEDLPALFNDLKIRLEDGFLLTAQQRANILAITQNVVYQPHQLKFKLLFKDVEDALEKQKEILRLTNIYGNPYREKQLNKLVRRVCSNVRNSYRVDICESIAGDKRVSLKDFSWTSAIKYKLGGPGDKLDVVYMAHNALLRGFALDNPSLRGAAENEDAEAEKGYDNETDDSPAPSAKRKRTTRGGPKPRPAKGEDFWARVDEHFAPKIKEYGPKITSEGWKTYLQEVLIKDELPTIRQLDHSWYWVGHFTPGSWYLGHASSKTLPVSMLYPPADEDIFSLMQATVAQHFKVADLSATVVSALPKVNASQERSPSAYDLRC
ncbi:hypothetical protein C8Q77DRAFT_1159871 [Trametes polyzona]|nr:hypothetical protein C8Q77DRAFT_1159871 [Trametes polyzona]